MDIDNIYYNKYLKYKNKYLELKNLRGGGNEEIRKIGKYFFRIMNKSNIKGHTSEGYTIVNICSSEDENLLKDENLSKCNKFSVYMSYSNLSCWRLCSRSGSDFHKGHRDYVQQTIIHPLLQKFIYEKINDLLFFENINFCNENDIRNHINEKNRQLKYDIFDEYNNIIICGKETETYTYINEIIIREKLTYTDIQDRLDKFSSKFKESYICHTESDETIYEYEVNNKDFIYQIKFKKVKLSNIETEAIIYLYYSSIYIEKFFDVKFDTEKDTKYYRIPTILTNDDEISKYGTFDKYISSGNYICKLFDYNTQSFSSEYGKTKRYGEGLFKQYELIGDRYNKLFPFNELDLD